MSEAMIEPTTIQEEYLWNSAREDQPPKKPLVEIGWVLIGTFEKIDEGAIRTARERTREYLRQRFPEFSWRVPIVVRPDPNPDDVLAEPIRLIDMAVTERLTKGWDFAIAFTATDLHALSKQYTLGTPASGLDAAAISTARLDPTAQRSMVRKAERELVLSNRIWALFLHLLGDLLALPHNDDHTSPMSVPRVPEDLDAVHDFSSEEHEWMLESLTEVADLRVEETGQSSRNPFFFTLRVLVRSGREIIAAVARNRPWILVWHLTKFTGAALSTLLILLFTAEVWDVGVRLPLAEVAGALGITIAGTTTFVVTRQRLLTRRTRFRLTEQVVVTDFAIILTILGSMLSMVLLLISAAMLVIWVVPNELALRWTDFAILSLEHNLALAGTVTIIGLIVGALGASIEDQTTFRHVAFIDEET